MPVQLYGAGKLLVASIVYHSRQMLSQQRLNVVLARRLAHSTRSKQNSASARRLDPTTTHDVRYLATSIDAYNRLRQLAVLRRACRISRADDDSTRLAATLLETPEKFERRCWAVELLRCSLARVRPRPRHELTRLRRLIRPTVPAQQHKHITKGGTHRNYTTRRFGAATRAYHERTGPGLESTASTRGCSQPHSFDCQHGRRREPPAVRLA
jgi:hypothetical protein